MIYYYLFAQNIWKKHTNWYFFAFKKLSFAIKYTYPYLSLYITKIKWFQSTVLQALSLKKRISTYKRKNLNNVFRCCHRKLHWYKRKREKNKNVKNSCALLLTNWEKKIKFIFFCICGKVRAVNINTCKDILSSWPIYKYISVIAVSEPPPSSKKPILSTPTMLCVLYSESVCIYSCQ